MALIGNFSLLNRTPYRQFATGISSGYTQCIVPAGALKNRNFGGFAETSATPNGYLAQMAWVLPMKPGGMSSYTTNRGSLNTVLADLKAGRNLIASDNIVISVTNAQLDQIIALIASGLIAISTNNAGLSAAVDASAAGTIFISTLSAQLGGIFDTSASGTITVTPNVTFTALANMVAEAGGPTPLSPEALAQAVWSALLADYPDIGTMGRAMSDAGGAGNPWSAATADNSDPGTFGKKIQDLLTRNFYLGTKD